MRRNHPRLLGLSYTGYVFVDESGNHTADDCYVVSGCYCVSSSADPSRVLQPTRDRILNYVVEGRPQSSPQRELKGTRLSNTTLDAVFSLVDKAVHDDPTLDNGHIPWVRESPIRFALHDSHGAVGRDVLSNYVSDSESHRPIQILALAIVLNPLLWTEYRSRTRLDRYHVVLDAPAWKEATKKVEDVFETYSWIPEFEFSIGESRSIPGIQRADMAAHARRTYVMTDDCAQASRKLDKFRI